jgi:transposase InsO family protein
MFTLLQNHHTSGNQLSLKLACSALGVSRSGYSKWIKQKQIHDSDPNEMKLKSEIQKIAIEFPGYGYRRIKIELHRRGIEVNRKLVRRLMKEDNLLCIRKQFVPRTTDSEHNLPVYPNLTKDMDITGINQYWAADITYIRLRQEFIYLAVVIDVYSRKCIGWKLGRDIDAKLALSALNMALTNRKNTDISKLIHHSDQGVQYASWEYVNRLKENSIQISMSRKGNPYDNAFAESFMKTLKYEEVYLWEYETFDEAYKNIKKFLEVVYNKKRIHSSIGYNTPEEFEKLGEDLNSKVS